MDRSIKEDATITITQCEYGLLIEALEEKQRKHKGQVSQLAKAGYGYPKTTTIEKMQDHNFTIEQIKELITKLTCEFI